MLNDELYRRHLEPARAADGLGKRFEALLILGLAAALLVAEVAEVVLFVNGLYSCQDV